MHIKIAPDVALAALRQKRDKQFRLWSLARAYDTNGRGLVAVDDLREWLDEQDNDFRGLSPGSVRRLLAAGEGIFWTRFTWYGQRWIRLHGILSVAVALGVEKLRRDPVLLPMCYARSLKSWRAAIAASMHGDDFGSPISRKAMQTITGKTPRSQRYYQAAMGAKMESRQNATRTGRPWRRGDTFPDELKEEGYFLDYVEGELEILKRLPNSYKAHLQRGKRGMMRRTNRNLRAGYSVSPTVTEEQTHKRRFYDDAKAANRKAQSGKDDQFFFLQYHYETLSDGSKMPTPRKTKGDTVLWDMATVESGRVFFS